MILGSPLGITDDDGILQLRRLGIVLLAHGSRAPFMQACAAWAISSAVMGYAAEAGEVAWALRRTHEDLDPTLLPLCRDLIGQGNLGVLAAHHLLTALGSRSARTLAEQNPTLPNAAWEQHQREHAADPCTSWIALDVAQCAACLTRTDIRVRKLIDKTGRWLVDPMWPVPDAFVERAASELAAMDPSAVGARMEVSYEDHLRHRLELVLAARRPEALAEFHRRVAQTCAARLPPALHALGSTLHQVTPTLTASEVGPVLDAVQRLDATCATRTENDNERRQYAIVSSRLLAAILRRLSPSARIGAIVQRPENAFDILDLEKWLDVVSEAAKADLIASIEWPGVGSPTRVRALWVLGACLPLDADLAACVERCGCDDDRVLRGVAFRIAYRNGDPVLGRALAAVARPTKAERTSWEASYGSSLIARWGQSMPIPELVARLHPAALTHALTWQKRSEPDAALAAVSFGAAWARVVGAEPPTQKPPPVETPPESETAGVGRPELPAMGGEIIRLIPVHASWRKLDAPSNRPWQSRDPDAEVRRWEEREGQLAAAWATDAFDWHGMGFDSAGLERMVRVRPDLAQQWAEGAMAAGIAGRRVRLQLATFHDALATAMFEAGHPIALQFWRALFQHADRRVDSGIAYSAFVATSTPASDEAKGDVLAACRVDKDIQAVALAALRCGRAGWLDDAVTALVRSPSLWRQATGLTLASFAKADHQALSALVATAGVEGTWVGDVVEDLVRRVEADGHAQAWYARYWEEVDEVAAWGAFRMVLLTADARFGVWRWAIEPQGGRTWKHAFVDCSAGELRTAAEKRAGADDKLFSLRIDHDQNFPFV